MNTFLHESVRLKLCTFEKTYHDFFQKKWFILIEYKNVIRFKYYEWLSVGTSVISRFRDQRSQFHGPIFVFRFIGRFFVAFRSVVSLCCFFFVSRFMTYEAMIADSQCANCRATRFLCLRVSRRPKSPCVVGHVLRRHVCRTWESIGPS